MTEEDIHGSEQKIERILEKHDYELLEEFNEFLTLQLNTTGNEHHYRFLSNLKQMIEYNENNENIELKDLNSKSLKKLLVQIENSEYYHGEYSYKTKNKYRATLKKLLKKQDKDWEELAPKGVTVHQSPGKVDTTDPDKIIDPSELKKFLRSVETRSKGQTKLRNLAFFFTLWDTGSRASGLIPAKKEHVEVKDKTVKLKIEATKKSPEKDIEVFFAAPVLKTFLENHPEPDNPYLFPTVSKEEKKQSKKQHVSYSSVRNLAVNIYKDLESVEGFNVAWRNQPLHIFRKSMKTYMDKMDILSETDLDVRAGHIIGSKYTRIYTRKSDEDSNKSMRKGLGIEDSEEKNLVDEIHPKNCSSCESVNSGHRANCRYCGNILDKKAYPEGVETDDLSKTKSKLQEIQDMQEELQNLEKQIKGGDS